MLDNTAVHPEETYNFCTTEFLQTLNRPPFHGAEFCNMKNVVQSSCENDNKINCQVMARVV